MLEPMATTWDSASAAYFDEWAPRFMPYHVDLIRELCLREGQRVLVVSAGPGAEVLAVARAVGPRGFVRATDKSAQMVKICRTQMEEAELASVACEVAEASDAHGGPWDAIVCAFGLWQFEGERSGSGTSSRAAALDAWRGALATNGKVGIVTWGPPDPDNPFERLSDAVTEREPLAAIPNLRALAERAAMDAMFAEAGLVMVRHTIVRHALSFKSAERFVRAMRDGCTLRGVWDSLGDARMEHVARAFYEWAGGPDAPLAFHPPAAVAIAGLPGSEVELAVRPSLRIPATVRGPENMS
jgi:SAM-dependent methyltransferase